RDRWERRFLRGETVGTRSDPHDVAGNALANLPRSLSRAVAARAAAGAGSSLSPQGLSKRWSPFEPGASSLLGYAQALDPHANQSLAAIFIHPYAECDVPRRRRKFICRAVEIDGATTPVALAQPKYEMLFV